MGFIQIHNLKLVLLKSWYSKMSIFLFSAFHSRRYVFPTLLKIQIKTKGEFEYHTLKSTLLGLQKVRFSDITYSTLTLSQISIASFIILYLFFMYIVVRNALSLE